MKNNSKTLTIETKKLWIIGAILSFIAAIYPTKLFVDIVKIIWEKSGDGDLFEALKFRFIIICFPYIFAFFSLSLLFLF